MDSKEGKGDCLIKDPLIDEFIDVIEMDIGSSKAESDPNLKTEMVPALARID